MSLALRLLHSRFLGGLSKNDRGLAPLPRALRWSSSRLLPCGNGTALNDPPLVYDLVLHFNIEGNCLCSQTAQSQFGAMALVALAEIRAPTEVKELQRVVATQVLSTRLCRHHLPVHLVLTRCPVLRPTSCESIVRLAATV